mmetsp:Transcript_8288/g.23017  ORF Transcript_8288/g.23017 Transcript_8288/m.23017 type:complete len:261 (+) Transcript_8288:267-1049(+)
MVSGMVSTVATEVKNGPILTVARAKEILKASANDALIARPAKVAQEGICGTSRISVGSAGMLTKKRTGQRRKTLKTPMTPTNTLMVQMLSVPICAIVLSKMTWYTAYPTAAPRTKTFPIISTDMGTGSWSKETLSCPFRTKITATPARHTTKATILRSCTFWPMHTLIRYTHAGLLLNTTVPIATDKHGKPRYQTQSAARKTTESINACHHTRHFVSSLPKSTWNEPRTSTWAKINMGIITTEAEWLIHVMPMGLLYPST